MSERNVTQSPVKDITTISKNPAKVAASAIEIIAPPEDMNQYGNTIEAFNEAKMPYGIIAKAGEERGDEVIIHPRVEAMMQEEWQDQDKGITQNPNKIFAWHKTGKQILTHQLPSPVLSPAESAVNEIISVSNISRELATPPSTPEIVDALEGIKIETKAPVNLQDFGIVSPNYYDIERANSRFFQPVQESKKAA